MSDFTAIFLVTDTKTGAESFEKHHIRAKSMHDAVNIAEMLCKMALRGNKQFVECSTGYMSDDEFNDYMELLSA